MRIEWGGQPEISAPLPWQGECWSRFNQQLRADNLPHALLLVGPEGIGKARLTLALSRLLLCAEPSEGLNCGGCHACELSESGSHGDLCWLQPEEKSRVIKIDQVRQAVAFTNQTASFGARKVVVLYPADSMNINAANALLKALEEPAPDTYLILAGHRLQSLPPTIRSRCQIVKLATPGHDLSLSWLDALTGDRQQSENLLSLAAGRPLLAERLYREGSADSVHSIRLALAGVLSGRVPAMDVAPLLTEAGADNFLDELQQALQRILRTQSAHILRSGEGRAAFKINDELARLRAAIDAGANPNTQLLVDSMLSRCQRELGGTLVSDIMGGHSGDQRP